ncbi:collagen alpha-6(VI) chain-like [Oculina patagonica]
MDVSLTSASDSAKCKLDLGLVVDTTKSIQRRNVPMLKNSLKQLIQEFDISEDGTHISFETFAKESQLHNTFKSEYFHSNKAMVALIQGSIRKLTQPTRLDKALFKADQEMFTEENGDRAGVPSVMLLYTDGKSHRDTEDYMPAVISLKEKGVRIVVVAIGKFATKDKYKAELNKIAGENIIYVDDYQDLTSATGDIISVICPPNTCENSPGLDVAFLVDRTGSLGIDNFRLLKGFLLELVDALNVGPDATHAAIVLFAKTAKVINTFSNSEYYSNGALRNLTASIPEKLGSMTFIDRALEAANEKLFTEEGGDRPEFPNVLILLTDGRTNENSTDYKEIVPLLKEKKVRIVAVGIGRNVLIEELEEITGNIENVYHVDNINGLPDLFSILLTETCSADGGFSRWGFWSECSKTCDGIQTRTRTCTNPPPQGYGEDCVGNQQETRACANEGPCDLLEKSHLAVSVVSESVSQYCVND